jgi:hypothetical protein
VQQAQLTGDTAYTAFAYVLKDPLAVGTAWRSTQGDTVRIVAVGLAYSGPLGMLAGCAETLQEAEPTPASRVLTWYRYAPDIGLVWQQRRIFRDAVLLRIDTMELQKFPEPWQL